MWIFLGGSNGGEILSPEVMAREDRLMNGGAFSIPNMMNGVFSEGGGPSHKSPTANGFAINYFAQVKFPFATSGSIPARLCQTQHDEMSVREKSIK